MLTWLRKPLSVEANLVASISIVVGTAAYCFAYNYLAGRAEPPLEGIAWALSNVLPWWLAFEAMKAREALLAKASLLVMALAASLLLQALLDDDWRSGGAQPGFELIRRLPALLSLGALLILDTFVRRSVRRSKRPNDVGIDIPQGIMWISAAGNYVELHGGGRVTMRRTSLASMERLSDFVRVHRGAMVRRSAIAKVRKADVLLQDGTSVRLGTAYRARLGFDRQDFRPFVPIR